VRKRQSPDHDNGCKTLKMVGRKRDVILVGDIGGTHTRLAIIEIAKEHFNFLAEETFSSREEPSLESALRKFRSIHSHPVNQACFGVAGPVRHGRCEATNLPWVIDSQKLALQLNLPRVGLINDLEASAYGMAVLEAKDFETLNQGAPDAQGNRAIVSAGTGLGEAVLYWDGKEDRPFASEGSHADFAPRNHLEMSLLDYLLGRFSRVSVERVVSGQGLLNIYQFLKDTGRADEPAWLAAEMHHSDPPKVITKNALEEKSTLCVQALDLFVSLYGAEAGNLALKVMATGGVYLGGGIAPKIISKLKDPIFMNAFTSKGRLRPLLQAIPVRVILNPKVALLGAARHATRQ
jgi:glucokinase